jgi:hypothetical protein
MGAEFRERLAPGARVSGVGVDQRSINVEQDAL